MTVYDDVERDARDDHRHNPPGYAARPTGRTLPSDQVLEQWYQDHYHDAGFGAFDETPTDDGDEAA